MQDLFNAGKRYLEEQQQGQGGGGYGNDAQQSNYGQGDSYGQQNSYGQQEQGEGRYNEQSSYGKQGGAEYNSPPAQFDLQGAASHASSSSDQDSSLFSNAASFLQRYQGSQGQQHQVDEEAIQNNHAQAYGNSDSSGMSADSLGSAAALQAFKNFTSGGGGGVSSSQGGGQSALIGMAMKEAAQLFQQNGGAGSGSQQDAVNSAGSTVLKLLMKQQMGSMMGGGNSGGLSSLVGMASKFM